MSYNTRTNTNTYTVVDIRKTFENCIADIRMIARRTRKWDPPYVDSLSKDILKLAENKYLSCVTIILKRKILDTKLEQLNLKLMKMVQLVKAIELVKTMIGLLKKTRI